MSQIQRALRVCLNSLRGLYDRWEFQHQKGQEDIMEIANLCRSLLQKADQQTNVQDSKDKLIEKWKSFQKHLDTLDSIYEKIINQTNEIQILQETQCYNKQCNTIPIFSTIPLYLFSEFILNLF